MPSTFRWLAAISCLVLASVALGADDVPGLIQQLDGPEFAQRQEASQKLSEAGKAVFPDLEKAAESGTREVASRIVDILKTHFTRGDDETKKAAKEALERLAKSGNGAAAQQATKALAPPPEETQPGIGGIFGGGIRVAGAQIQIQVQANGGNGAQGRKIKISEANGKREVEVEEGDRKVKMVKQPGGSIEIEITEKVNGKETTRKVEAKDLDDLKKKDPAAAQEYEKYSQNGGGNIQINGIQINGGGIQIRGGAVPVPINPAPNAQPQGKARELQLQSLEKSLERLKAQLPQNPRLQGIIDLMEQQKKALEDAAKPADAKPAEAKPEEAK
jgi:hypothetical protein